MRKFFRIVYYCGGIFLFVLIAVIGYTQTRSFRTYLRNTLLQESRTVLNGQLRLGTIEGNLLTGFKIQNVAVSLDGEDVFSTKQLILNYDPLGILFKRITVSHVVIDSPQIHIHRSVDGELNVSRLVKPSSPDSSPSAWIVNIARLELEQADITYTDSLYLFQRTMHLRETPPDSAIDYARIHLQSVFLQASTEIRHDLLSVKVNGFRFHLQTPRFTLEEFTGEFLLSNNQVRADHVRIQTPSTRLHLDAGMSDVDLVHVGNVEDLKNKAVELSFSADSINTRELKQFLYPWVDFLDREVKLELKASGRFGDLRIEQLTVRLPESVVHLQGQVRNLHHTRDLELSLNGNGNSVMPKDLLDCLPGLNLPDLEFLGPVKYSLTYEGRPLDFKARVKGACAAGAFDVDGRMNVQKSAVSYSARIAVDSLALGTILNADDMTSSLNAKIAVDGTNFNPRTMTAVVRIEVDSSTVNDLPVQKSVAVLDIADAILRLHVAASVGSGTYELTNTVKFLPGDSAQYDFAGRVLSLDLGELLQEKKYGSDLSFTYSAWGTIGPGARSDTADFRFLRSMFGPERFDDAEAHWTYQELDSVTRVLKIRSTPLDLDVSGDFEPASFLGAWKSSYEIVAGAVADRFAALDSLGGLSQQQRTVPASRIRRPSSAYPLRAIFHLQARNLKPVGAFIQTPLGGHGSLDGELVRDADGLRLKGTTHLAEFGVRTGTDSLSADTAALEYAFDGLKNATTMETLTASVDVSLRNFEVNSLLFNRVDSRVDARSGTHTFQISTLIDSTASLNVSGTLKSDGNAMEFEIPELKTSLGGYAAENTDTVRLLLARDGLRAQVLRMSHESEDLDLTGDFSPSGSSNLSVSVNGFLLSDLKQILYRGAYGKSTMQFAGIMNARTSLRGSLGRPEIDLEMNADGVRADDLVLNKHKVLGKVGTKLAYADHMLNLSIQFRSRPDDTSAADLLLAGKLPYDFTLSREAPHPLEGNVDLTLKSTGLNLEFLDPFIPDISDLSGAITCDMQMKGPLDAPLYAGTMSIRNAKFIFTPLGIPYIMNGDLNPAGDRIRLERFTVRNDPRERFHVGTMNVTGSLTLKGLRLNGFDLLMDGDLLVMSQDTRWQGQKMYGNLFTATGPNGLRWQGDLSSSMVKGTMLVRDAQLVLPPEKETQAQRTKKIDVTFVDDTSHVDSLTYKNPATAGQKKIGSANGNGTLSEKMPETATGHSSFLDGISYDVTIETRGPTQLRFIINTQTNEELFADLQGSLYFNKAPGVSRLIGQVDVGSLSYYTLIKKFEATGKLLFTGDVSNPELEIKATYQGTHSDTSGVGGVQGGQKEEQVLVTLHITGTRNEPKAKFTLETKRYEDKDWQPWGNQGDEEGNAISYILAGQFKDEVNGLMGSSLGISFAKGMVTSLLSDAVRKSTRGVVQTVDVDYGGGQFNQSADLRLTGQVGPAVIRAGGRVFNDIGNTNASVELPMSTIMNSERFRNLILTLERRVEGIQTAEEQRRSSNGARLFYRIIF